MQTTSIILAAGKGTRMKSRLPKVLHSLLGKPILSYTINAAVAATAEKPVVIIGHGAELVRDMFSEQVRFVTQENRLGTGHAVQQAESLLRDKTDAVLVTYGDMPLIKADTLKRLVQAKREHPGPLVMLTVVGDDPRGFGRIVRGPDGLVKEIVEEVQATPDQLAIRELNPGVYCFQADWLWDALQQIELSPKGEYFLTDLVGIAVREGKQVKAIQIDDPEQLIGINTRVHLAEATAVLQGRINMDLMLDGVTILDPKRTYIESGVKIGVDTVIWPETYLQGDTVIGENCQIGPGAVIRDARLGNRCKVFSAVIERAVLENGVTIGPYGHLRKGAHLAEGVHMGNFGEVKNSYLGPGTKMGHFSYLGDATIGENVNIGAGTITCNYDGERKYPTEIGSEVFIGSDTMLVAPVRLAKGARTGAGSVITRDVPENSLAVGMPARVIRKNKENKNEG
jgi:bifunctional UDP-N-acetylglucosamine pyrophosphorylase/glucosamine-1-phosphate N-acetyltransferase